jgi:TolA-binding protein
MQCRDESRQELLEKYLLGQLEPVAQDNLEVHLLECPGCLHSLETMQLLRDELAKGAAKIRSYTPPRRVWVLWQFVGVFTVILVVIGAMSVMRMRHADREYSQAEQGTRNTKANLSTGRVTHSATPTLGQPIRGIPARSTNKSGKSTTTANAEPTQTTNMEAAPPVAEIGRAHPVESGDHEQANVPSPTAPSSAPSTGLSEVSQVATGISHGTEQSTARPIDEQVEAELFRLGVVQAPPYTFSGFAGLNPSSPDWSSPESSLNVGISAGKSERSGSQASGPRAKFQKAMRAYVERRYRDALFLLEEAVAAEPKAKDANFYLGICRLLTGHPKDAVLPLKVVLEQENSAYTQRAHFYLAKAYLQTRNFNRAEDELQAATSMPGALRSTAGSELARLRAVIPKLKAPTEANTPAKPQ